MVTLLSFLLAIAVLVTFHELGHYWVARLCGVKVLRFSVGFGNVIYRKRFAGSDTEWVLSALPLGGYVKMLDEREGEVAEYELPRAFNRQSVFKRMAIVVAGPVANLLLAIVLYWGLFLHGMPGLKPILAEPETGTPAAVIGLHSGDQLMRINAQAVPSWQEARWLLLDLALQDAPLQLEILRSNGQQVQHSLPLNSLTPADLDSDFLRKLGLTPYQPMIAPIIGKLSEDGVAQRAGLQSEDRILSLNGEPLSQWEAFVAKVRNHPGTALQLEISRDGHVFPLTLTPERVSENGVTIGKIGAAPFLDRSLIDPLLTEVRYGFLDSGLHALTKTWETAIVSLKMMAKMVTGEVSMKNLSGPLSLADYAGQSAQLGVIAYIGFLALVSISLGILNLLPVPILDGGHLLYYSAELIKGSPVSEKTWEIGQRIGVALLVTLMAMALYNDLSRLFSG